MRRSAPRLGVLLLALSCQRAPAERRGAAGVPPPAPAVQALDALRRSELSSLAGLDLTALPRADTSLGPDPYAIVPVSGSDGARFVGLLRGEPALVLLDRNLNELARTPVPRGVAALTAADDGSVWAASELESKLRRYETRSGKPALAREIDLGEVVAVRALAAAPRGLLHLVEEEHGRLVTVDARDGSRHSLETGCSSAFEVLRTSRSVGVLCLHDHRFASFGVDPRGLPRAPALAGVEHDGPIWAADVIRDGDAELVALAGVEDHPLDRTIGSFGYIDSFLFLYRLAPGAAPVRLAAVNVSELGLVTPKVVALERDGTDITISSVGYGSGVFVALRWPGGDFGAPEVITRTLRPGIAAWARTEGRGYVAANPLFDGWHPTLAEDALVEVASSRAPAAATRLGEAAFFTTLMSPFNSSDGPKSRFTCETCHFEGYNDGRVHHSGRGEVRVSTKSLLGLVNNRPYFSRAVDHDLTEVVDNEFEVASRGSGHPAWFSVGPKTLPWLAALAPGSAELDPVGLRRSLLEFLTTFNHRPNPRAWQRTSFTALEREGAREFETSCERCHAARLMTTDPASRVPPERWESLVLSASGPIVWGRAEYEKTGIEPYVHGSGARVPSLRRLYKKRPYFTNGSARTLDDVLARVRHAGDRFVHDPARAEPDLQALPEDRRAALRAFLKLL